MSPLSLSHLTLKRSNRLILNDITLQLKEGTLNMILGSNGAGKSSLLSAICGELPHQGGVQLFGRSRSEWEPALLATRLAVLPQSSSLNFDFLCHEVVQLGRLPHRTGIQKDRLIVAECLEQVDAAHLAFRPYPLLSGGEKQRVHLARVLAQLQGDAQNTEPRVLLLDEPTAALDLKHQHQTLQLMHNYARQGHTVLVILHDLNLAARYGDRLIFLHEGRCYADGTPEAVLIPSVLRQVFDIEMSLWRHPQTGVLQVI